MLYIIHFKYIYKQLRNLINGINDIREYFKNIIHFNKLISFLEKKPTL